MSSLFLILTCLFALCLSAPGGCDFADAIPDATFRALLSRMAAQGFQEDKIKVLQSFVSNNTLGFSSNQTVTVLKEFGLSTFRVQAIQTLNPFILTLNCAGIVSLLQTAGLSSEKFQVLTIVVNLANEADLKINNNSIIAQFSLSSDQARARQIIENAKPRSCLFGPANIPLFAFIIDVSGSMSTQFRDQDGTLYSRLGYVQRDLGNVLNTTLQATQKFNIISFSDSARAWQPGVVPVTAANIASATNFVNALRPGGGTAMLNALKAAFSDTSVMGVYFLSDGAPTDSQANILTFATGLRKPVNTIAFKAEVAGQQFLLRLANSTKGTFRNIV